MVDKKCFLSLSAADRKSQIAAAAAAAVGTDVSVNCLDDSALADWYVYNFFATQNPSSGDVTSVNGLTGDVTLTAAEVGALPNTTVVPVASTATPLVASGTGAVGTSTAYARGDHVHPVQSSVTGNAGTATALQTGRTITLTGGATGASAAFDGSANASIAVTLATPTTTVKGGILQQAATADLTADPTMADFNALLAKLRSSGLLAT